MKIIKEGAGAAGAALSREELALINGYAKKELSAEEVYAFSLVLCDNEVDRDFERFSEKTLGELAELFVGRTGISDHEWKSGGQVARIYRTALLRDGSRKTRTGEDYVYLKAWAYMLRSPENAGLIADIDGGIKKETSVGCAVAESVCSICGEPMGSCGHVKGQEYGGKLCYATLEGAVDAYEWSFVAVPAQRNAGVTKGLKGFAESGGGGDDAGELERLAALGRAYEKRLRDEVLRLCLLADKALHASLSGAVERMDAPALESLKETLEQKAAEKLPLATQLPGMKEITRFDGGEYLI